MNIHKPSLDGSDYIKVKRWRDVGTAFKAIADTVGAGAGPRGGVL